MIIPYNATIDLKGNNSKIDTIKATIGDSKSIQLNINVIIGTSIADLTGHTAKITFTKPDNTKVFQDLTIDDAASGKMHVVISNQAFAVAGQIDTEIEIFDATDGRLTSHAFAFTAKTGLLDDTAIISTDQFTALTQALSEVTDFATYRTELTNSRQGFTDLPSNLANKDARLNHLGFDFLQQGAIADGVTDCRPLLQSLMDTLSTMGGGNIYIPDGTYFFSQDGTNEWSIKGKSNVNVYGAGIGKTILKIGGSTYQGYSLFWYKPSVMDGSQYIKNVIYRDFTVDGYDMTMQYYTHKGKAFYFQAIKNSIFENLDLKGLPSTALGVDFLDKVNINKVNCTDCGRLWEEAWHGADGSLPTGVLAPGGAGIGIGTGLFAEENFTISDCVCTGSGHYGIFLEHQGIFDPTTFTQPAKGVVISNCICSNGRFGGIGVRGGANITISGCQAYGNKHGMFFDAGESAPNAVVQFKNIIVSNCGMTDNTQYGGYLAGNIYSENFTFSNNTIANNGAEGLVLCRNGIPQTHRNTVVAHNIIKSNALEGIYVDTSTTLSGIEIKHNEITFNGGNGIKCVGNVQNGRYVNNFILNNTGAGINLTNAKFHLEIKDNYVRDNQGTKTQQYGLYHNGGGVLTNSTITDNDFRLNGTKSIVIPDSSIDNTSYVRANKEDSVGMLSTGSLTYASFPSQLANFSSSTTITIRLKFKVIAFDAAGVSVKALLLSQTKDFTVTSNPQGWNLYANGSYQLVLDVRQSDGSTLIQRVGTTALATGTTYDLTISIGASTTFTLNSISEPFSSSTGTDADLLTAMKNNNTGFPVYLDGGYYNGVLKNADNTKIQVFNINRGSGLLSSYNFDNYGVNRPIFDANYGLHGSSLGGTIQTNNFNSI